jgi:hypothetical protein
VDTKTDWTKSVRRFVVTRDTTHLDEAIRLCDASGTRQYLMDFRTNPDRIPVGAVFGIAHMIRESGREAEGNVLELMCDLEMAILAEHPERIGPEKCRIAVAMCRMKIDLCRRCGFRECEAEFHRILGGHAMEFGRWEEAARLLQEAKTAFEEVRSEFEDACRSARVMTLNNLALVKQRLGR